MNASATIRQDLAARVADDLLSQPDVIEVWMEGALAEGLAHGRSDIDLRILAKGEPAPWRSRVVDDIRVDLVATDPADLSRSRAVLEAFDVRFDDVETFRQVRAQLGLLTRLRTARRRCDAQWQPVLAQTERDGYRRWAVADRAEHVLSLTEDLLGLVADGMTAEADIVWHDLRLALAGLECAVADQPLLSTKWLPALCARANASQPLLPRRPGWSTPDQPWFTSTRTRHTTALLACWPLTAVTDPQPCPPGTLDLGWLPQRYADGWFLRRGDDRVPLTNPQVQDWCTKTVGQI